MKSSDAIKIIWITFKAHSIRILSLTQVMKIKGKPGSSVDIVKLKGKLQLFSDLRDYSDYQDNEKTKLDFVLQ